MMIKEHYASPPKFLKTFYLPDFVRPWVIGSYHNFHNQRAEVLLVIWVVIRYTETKTPSAPLPGKTRESTIFPIRRITVTDFIKIIGSAVSAGSALICS